MLTLPALVAKWQTRTLEVRVEKSMGVRVSPSAHLFFTFMAKGRTNPKVDRFLRTAPKWRKEIEKLRKILLGCGLTEEFKWNKPCYTFEESNVVVMLPLKEYCALLFCKGALVKDTAGILIQTTENTQAARQIRFTTLREIGEKETAVTACIQQAIEAEKAGLEVVYKKTADYKIPDEFRRKLDEVSSLKTAFEALTPGRQRAYLLYFSAPKQSKTRDSRIEKRVPHILKGKGLND
jgi:uncharacterized protein YdeI (YjbR/CyaY-like superfamily)